MSFQPPSNHTIQVPVAKNRDGSSITGPLVLRFMSLTGNTTALVIPRGQPSPYPPVSLDTTKASLTSATGENATGAKKGAVTIPSTDWAFADCSTTPFPGKPDPDPKICVKNGFDPALLYELRYTVKDPLVLGIGLAATRDLGAFFRYETADAAGTPNPVAGRITHAISEGSSQSGTFLRLSLLLGFNQDERGRIVWDGMNPHIAARFTDLNRRFAFPGRPRLAVRARSRRARVVDAVGRHGSQASQPRAFSIAAGPATHARRSRRRSGLQKSGDCASRLRWSGRQPRRTSRCRRMCGAITSLVCRTEADREDLPR